MKQLDFSDIDIVRSADQKARHGAFWGPLGETGRAAARVACDFFAFAEDVNRQMALHLHCKDIDPEKSMEAFNRAQMYACVALGKFRLFGRLAGCRDDAEATHRLDRLIAYSQKTGWQIYPDWWTKVPNKNTAYFINQLKINAGQYVQYLAICRDPAKAKAEAKAGKKAEDDKKGGEI